MSELISLNMGNLTATVDPMGAQLCSLKLNQNEYLWQGNPAFWSRRAPIFVSYSRLASQWQGRICSRTLYYGAPWHRSKLRA